MAAKKKTAKKAPTKRLPARKVPAKKVPARKVPVKKAAARKPAARVDLGAPIDGFFAKQPAHLRKILSELRKLVADVVPEADSSIKWGMPFYTLNGAMMCALTAHKSHVNLVLAGPPGTYADPEGRLEGSGKTGRHLKLSSLAELPRATVRGWLRTAADTARA